MRGQPPEAGAGRRPARSTGLVGLSLDDEDQRVVGRPDPAVSILIPVVLLFVETLIL
jgi:hypothetical protein